MSLLSEWLTTAIHNLASSKVILRLLIIFGKKIHDPFDHYRLTSRNPRSTDNPLTISSPRSTSEAKTMTKSKTFHPLRKKSVPRAPSLIKHSIVKTAVKTWITQNRIEHGEIHSRTIAELTEFTSYLNTDQLDPRTNKRSFQDKCISINNQTSNFLLSLSKMMKRQQTHL